MPPAPPAALSSPAGLGLVHTQDVGIAADAIERGLWTPEEVRAAQLPGRFGHVLSPAQHHAEAAAVAEATRP